VRNTISKVCTKCKQMKPLTDFYVNNRNPDRFDYNCKSCDKKRVDNRWPSRRLVRYKSAAKERRIAYELSREEFMSFWQKPCHYCGEPIETIGIDRIDNTRGYVMGNCVPCCRTCNIAKSQMTLEEFLAWAARLAKHLFVKSHA
jgi:hypothetical protein